MELGEYEELKQHLEKDYVLTNKRKLWSFAGGAVAFLIAAGFISFEAGRRAIDSAVVNAAIAKIEVQRLKAEELVTTLETKAQDLPEFKIPSVAGGGINGWKELVKLHPQSFIKIEAYTSENFYMQPWIVYAWRAYEEQEAGMYVVPFPKLHEYSAAVEWEMLKNGTIQVRASAYEPSRIMKIYRLDVLRGEADTFIGDKRTWSNKTLQPLAPPPAGPAAELRR